MSKCERWKRRDSNHRSWASRKADPPRFAQETRWIMRLCGSLRSEELRQLATCRAISTYSVAFAARLGKKGGKRHRGELPARPGARPTRINKHLTHNSRRGKALCTEANPVTGAVRCFGWNRWWQGGLRGLHGRV